MPFKSESQRRRLTRMMKEGKISAEEFARWKAETPPGVLPERLHTKPKKPKRPPRK